MSNFEVISIWLQEIFHGGCILLGKCLQ